MARSRASTFQYEDKFAPCYLVDSAKNLVRHAEYEV